MRNKIKFLSYLVLVVMVSNVAAPFLPTLVNEVSAPPADWWNTDWNYRKTLTISKSVTTENLVDYPLLIDVTDSDLALKSRGGADIAFVDMIGVKLSHEIESYVASTGHLRAWVKIPLLSSSVDTSFYVYYGNGDVASQEDREGVWSSGYRLVEHLNEGVDQACRMWGMVSTSLPQSVVMDQLVTLPYSLKNLGGNVGSNNNGWGLAYYDTSASTFQVYRGLTRAYLDPNFDVAAGQVSVSGMSVALGHVRKAASGASNIPNPHPFIRTFLGKTWALSHNGVLNKANLKTLIGSTYLSQFTPAPNTGANWDDPLIVDTDLYLIWVLKCIEGAGGNVLQGIGQAESDLSKTDGGAANFLLSDGTTLWGYRKGNTLYYKQESAYSAIVSQPPEGTTGNWIQMSDYNLVELETGASPILYTDIRGYVQTKNVYDSTSNRNNGVASGNIVLGAEGKIDGSYEFDGSTAFIQIPHSATLTGFTTGFTASFWIKMDTTARRQTILNNFYNDENNRKGYIIDFEVGKALYFFASADGSVYSQWGVPFDPEIASWHFATIVWQPNIVPKFYIDGSQVASSGTGISTIYANAEPLFIGKCSYAAGREFDGALDEVRISGEAKSAGWILTDYNGQNNPSSYISKSVEEAYATKYFLQISIPGGHGSITLSSLGPYDPGTLVQVTAVPDVGYSFDSWSGDVSGNVNPTTITMDSDKAITATFKANDYTITVNVVGSGSVAKSPNQATYAYGTSVQITASTDSGYFFSGWSGDLVGSENPGTIIVNVNKAVTATFAVVPSALLVDSSFDANTGSTDLRDDSADQDWYESRGGFSGGDSSLLILDTSTIGYNTGKKAGFVGSSSGNAYLTQQFAVPQTGVFSAQWDIYVDSILPSSPYRAGMMMIGTPGEKGPCSTDASRLVYMAFYKNGGGTSGTMDLVAKTSFSSDTVIVPGLNLKQWYTIKVVCDVAAKAYDIYVDGVYKTRFSRGSGFIGTSVTHISFAQWNDGAGAFYVDNVYAPAQAYAVVNYVAVWSYSAHDWVSEGGSVLQGQTIRIYAGISNPVEPVSISYGPTGSLTTVTALYESTWDYYYVDWVIPYGATTGLYDVKVESGVTSVTVSGRFQVSASAPVVGSVAVWSYSDHDWISQGGTVVQGHTVRIYAAISDVVEPVSISYGPTGLLTTVTASYESTWDYYYFDWVIPSDATLGSYDVKFESGVTSETSLGRFQVAVSAPVVNYVAVWSYADHNWVSQGGTVLQGHTVRIYAGISNPVEPVSISYGSTGSLTTVTALYESTWDYYYFDWAIPSGATTGLYDVKVESGVTYFMANGRFQVGASAPVVNYVAVWSYSDHDWISQGGTVVQGHTVRIYAGISNPVEPVSISYGPSGGSLTTVTALYESTWDYYYFDWVIPSGATTGLYDVKVDTGGVSTASVGRFNVAASTVDYDDIVFDSSFETGNLKNVQFQSGDVLGNRLYTGEQDHTIVSGMTDKHWWFYFNMDNVAGKTVTIRLVNNEIADMSTRWSGMEPVYSFDNVNWERLPPSNFTVDISGRSFQMTVALGPTENKIWLAPLPPYTISLRDALFNDFASSPYLNVTSLGTTPGGQELKVATITDKAYDDANKIKAYVIAMQHSTEVPGGWEADGMIRFLLSDDPTAQVIRRSYIFRIVPIVNVDGVFYGRSRYTPLRDGVQYDLNRWWGYSVGSMPFEVAALFSDIQEFQPDSFIDIHSTIGAEMGSPEDAVTYTWSTSDPTVVAFLNSIRDAGWPDTQRGTSPYACSQVHSRLGVVRSISWENPQDEFITNPGHKLTASDWRQMGRVYAEGVYLDGTRTPFTIVVLPDTQFYSESYPAIFDNQTQWISSNKIDMNVVFVTQEGDIVNTNSQIYEWQNANSSMSTLDEANVPWGLLPGNHDLTGGSTNYNTYFGYDRFSGLSWYGGAYQNVNTNNYELFSGGLDDYLIFHFQYNASDQVLAWANSTMQSYPDRRVIVTTHDYMNVDGTRTETGDRIWQNFVAPHADQVFLVLCGHNHGENKKVDIVNRHTVYQLLADYQSRPNGGNGWLRILEFSPTEDTILVKTFSPYLDDWETDSDSQFTLSYDMSERVTFTSDLGSPAENYRWMDVADQTYSSSYQDSYAYTQAYVYVSYSAFGNTLTGTLVAQDLKPNFAYQLKLVGTPGTAENELIGLAGRWWQEEWSGSAWINGQNLNNKGNGSSPNPNDDTYYARKSITDASSPTGFHYRYTGYLLFGYFITDSNGDAALNFKTGSCCHVLWKTSQRARTADDGPLRTVTFDPILSAAYDVDYPSQTVSIFGEWERLPMGSVNLAAGSYNCQIVLTEESFHGTGLQGNWAAAMAADVLFTIVA